MSPTLNKDISFIRKAYSDALGDLIYEAGFGTYSTTEENRIDEIKNFLKREEGRDKDWIDKILKYFNKCIYGNKNRQQWRTTDNQKNFVAKSEIYIYKTLGRLILMLSLLVEIICFYWINYTSCVLYNDGIFSYEIILNNWRGVLDIIVSVHSLGWH